MSSRVMGWQWGKRPWMHSPYIQISDVFCYKPISIINPDFAIEKLQARPFVTIWCGIHDSMAVNPYILRDKMNTKRYVNMLENFVLAMVSDWDEADIVHFMQDGTLPCFAIITQEWFSMHFLVVLWECPGIPHLTLLDTLQKRCIPRNSQSQFFRNDNMNGVWPGPKWNAFESRTECSATSEKMWSKCWCLHLILINFLLVTATLTH